MWPALKSKVQEPIFLNLKYLQELLFLRCLNYTCLVELVLWQELFNLSVSTVCEDSKKSEPVAGNLWPKQWGFFRTYLQVPKRLHFAQTFIWLPLANLLFLHLSIWLIARESQNFKHMNNKSCKVTTLFFVLMLIKYYVIEALRF